MRFVKIEHLRVPGHTPTILRASRIMTRISQDHFNTYDGDEDERKKKRDWRSKFQALEQLLQDGEISDCAEAMEELVKEKDLPDPVRRLIKPIAAEFKEPLPDLVGYLFVQTDTRYDVIRIEDGRDRVLAPADEPHCTITYRNGLWNQVMGTAESVVEQIMARGVKLTRGELESQIAGAIKSSIDSHGPVTVANLSSAAKRVVGVVKQLGVLFD